MSKMFSKLPWAHPSHAAQEDNDQSQCQSLTTVLSTPQDRSELTILVANCTETMRKAIVDTFDPHQTGQPLDSPTTDLTADIQPNKVDIEPEDSTASAKVDTDVQDGTTSAKMDTDVQDSTTSAKVNTDVQDSTSSAKVYTDVQDSTTSAKVNTDVQDKAKQDLAQRKKELSAPRMKNLKDAALVHFDDWRESVLSRVGEVVNSREAATEQKKDAKPATPHSPPRRTPEPPKYDEKVAKALVEHFPPVDTPLKSLDEPYRALILHSMLLLLLSLEHYSAHSRILLLHLTSSLNLTINFLATDESKIARGLLKAVDMKADSETQKKVAENSDSRKWKVGLATVAGAALIGVTGGLAAPLLAAGVGTVMSGLGLGATVTAGYLGTLAGSTVLVGGLFGAYGGRMTGKMMDEYAKEVEDFAFIPIRTYHKPRKIEKEFRRLRVAIGVSGWLTDKDDIVDPWTVIGPEMEAFALRFELEALMNLGNSLTTMIKSAAWSYAKSEIIKRTVFASLMAGLWPLGLLKVGRIIDNPFSIAKARSDKAGLVLADALINRAQGERPVTLIGYSLGARVIYTCLKTLAERKAFGLVESAVLLGAPTPSTASDWRLLRTVVAGRLVNVYSTSDYILGFLYRSSSIQYGIAGLQPVASVAGIQNVDVSDIVQGHLAYRFLTGTILKKIGFEDVDLDALAKEEARFREEKKEAEFAQEAAVEEQSIQSTDGIAEAVVSDQEVAELEKQVELKNQESMMGWMTEKLKLGGESASGAAAQAKTWYTMRTTAAPDASAADESGVKVGHDRIEE